MAVSPSEQNSENYADIHPLLMERAANGQEHVIDILQGNIASTSVSHGNYHDDSEELHNEDRPSTTPPDPTPRMSFDSATTSRNASFTRRSDSYVRRHRSPLNSGLWITVELVVNLTQIIASIAVLCVSRDEHPQTPLFAWIVGYTVGCFASLPHLYWRYLHRNSQISEQESARSNQNTSVSVRQSQTQENDLEASTVQGQSIVTTNRRINSLVDHCKMALDCYFAVWFVVGNVWIFGGHSSSTEAPNLYRLCIVYLTFSCIGYAMPFILCAMICCCLPCIISIMGIREDMGQNRGASTESINALPKYKFKLKRRHSKEDSETNSDSLGDGGIIAAGTSKERIISAEDAVCCICLAKYADNEDLRELQCSHFFHMDCVDKWLKINALCPLCKAEVGNTRTSPGATSGRRHNDRRVGNGAEHHQEVQ